MPDINDISNIRYAVVVTSHDNIYYGRVVCVNDSSVQLDNVVKFEVFKSKFDDDDAMVDLALQIIKHNESFHYINIPTGCHLIYTEIFYAAENSMEWIWQ